MGEIVLVNKLAQIIAKLKKKDKKIVLVGGCFDILHPGHVIFLEKAKQAGDVLFVMLESDQKVRLLKGSNRPIHTQKMRARVLSALCSIDYIVMLPTMKDNSHYDKLIERIRPSVIAASGKDVDITNHKRASKLVGAQFKVVTKAIQDHSSSSILTV